uniref:CRK-CRKL-like protein ancestral isoform 2 n=1 Tax=Monosiga brevicollis TaxID=81824 RepID=A0A1C9VNR3_MONBE|nr:CRK-CRKL-like protein ancestral isoform 2 [Monosiga brevicollis]
MMSAGTSTQLLAEIMEDILTIRREAFSMAGPAPAWYHGQVSRTDADSRLRGTPEGTFIIRDSSKGGSFVLSVSEGGKVSHYKIDRRSPCVYEIGDESFANLPEIIEFYKRHMLDTTPLSVPLPLEGELVGAELAANYLTEATALYNFNARDPEDLSFRKGEQLFVLEVTEREWWKAQSRATRQIGMVPANYLKTAKNILPDLPADSAPEAPAPEAMAPAAIDPTPPPLASRGPLPPPPAETLAAIDPTPVVTPSLPSREPNNAPARAPASSSVVPSYFYELSKDKLPDRPNFVVCRAKLDRNAKSFDKSALSFKVGDNPLTQNTPCLPPRNYYYFFFFFFIECGFRAPHGRSAGPFLNALMVSLLSPAPFLPSRVYLVSTGRGFDSRPASAQKRLVAR